MGNGLPARQLRTFLFFQFDFFCRVGASAKKETQPGNKLLGSKGQKGLFYSAVNLIKRMNN
jgi:hypothetical protein